MPHKKFKARIEQFAHDFFNYLENEIPHTDKRKNHPALIKNDIIYYSPLPNKHSLYFIKSWGNRKFYIFMFKENDYIWEVFLPRIIFNSETNITWYLSKPKNKHNIEIYDKILTETHIDSQFVTLIKNQQDALHNSSSLNRVNRGYLIANEEDKTLAFDRLKNIILAIIGVSTGNDIDNEYPEGKRTSTNSTRVTRNRQYVDAVKERDGYTCQACGLKAKIDGFDILQVHHIIRLTDEQSTKLSDLVSLCPTCHFIAHTNDPPLKIKEIKRRLNKHNLHTYS